MQALWCCQWLHTWFKWLVLGTFLTFINHAVIYGLLPHDAFRIFSLTPMPRLEPTSAESHQTGTFRTLYRLSYRAAAGPWYLAHREFAYQSGQSDQAVRCNECNASWQNDERRKHRDCSYHTKIAMVRRLWVRILVRENYFFPKCLVTLGQKHGHTERSMVADWITHHKLTIRSCVFAQCFTTVKKCSAGHFFLNLPSSIDQVEMLTFNRPYYRAASKIPVNNVVFKFSS